MLKFFHPQPCKSFTDTTSHFLTAHITHSLHGQIFTRSWSEFRQKSHLMRQRHKGSCLPVYFIFIQRPKDIATVQRWPYYFYAQKKRHEATERTALTACMDRSQRANNSFLMTKIRANTLKSPNSILDPKMTPPRCPQPAWLWACTRKVRTEMETIMVNPEGTKQNAAFHSEAV